MNARGYTVVICTYNRRDQASECVQSVLQQTRPPEQVIVVDDGSLDGTAEYLRDRFPTVDVVEQPNLGRSLAANHAIALAAHEWICLLDDDDLWHRDKLAETDGYLAEHPDCLAVNHPVWFFLDSSANPTPTTAFGFDIDFVARDLQECHAAVAEGDPSRNDASYLSIYGESYERLLNRNAGAYSASVIRRDVLIGAGGLPPSLTSADDWTLFLNVARLAEWHTLPRRLAFYRVHGAQSTGDATNARAILAAHLVVWFGGRPFPDRRTSDDVRRELAKHQVVYRELVQLLLWSSLKHGRFQLALEVRRLGRPLVSGWRNWMYVHLPPRVTTRLLPGAR
jgi:glycosyltransferase involved in cell wall biosynthesis